MWTIFAAPHGLVRLNVAGACRDGVAVRIWTATGIIGRLSFIVMAHEREAQAPMGS